MEHNQAIGIIAAYMVIEVTKFLVNKLGKNFDSQDKVKLHDLWQWHMKRQPSDIHQQMERMVELLLRFEFVQKQQLEILQRLTDRQIDHRRNHDE